MNQIKDFEELGKIPILNPKKQINVDNEKAAVQSLLKTLEDTLDRYPESYKVEFDEILV